VYAGLLKVMTSQNLHLSDAARDEQETLENSDLEAHVPTDPPVDIGKVGKGLSPFWHDRLIEASLILSIALYYVIGNEHLGKGYLFQLNPLFAIPFLLVFVALCWYRLPFAVALLPLALPYYLLHKTIFSHYSFSLIEITFGICLIVAVGQLLLQRTRWQYWLTWRELRGRFGPFTIPILVFFIAAAFSIVIAYEKVFAQRAFREEVFDPLIYVLLAFYCLRSRQDVTRLLAAILGTGLMVAIAGIVQYVFLKNQVVAGSDNLSRVYAMYGSANSIGILFDYVLPVGFALVVARTQYALNTLAIWRGRLAAIAFCLVLLYVLYLSQSDGAWLAIAVAALFIVALSIRRRKTLLIAAPLFVMVLGITFFLFHTRIMNFIFDNHVDVHSVSTATKRLYLWRSALDMIHDSPWFGYGMDNWLCHFSLNYTCFTPQLHHYLIANDPVTHMSTDLKFEPDLSHPHNVFLHIWLSMGIFGMLAFAAILVLFFWLFVRILRYLRSYERKENLYLQWMTIGVGAAMLAALIQGQVDSTFLEQDAAFNFWMLVVALLLLRALSGTPWRGRLKQ
jgi:O-antigen ligase